MAKNVEDYLAMGFDRKAAEYFAAGRKKLVSVQAESGLTLLLAFDNGEQRRFDMRPIVKDGTVFSFLADYANFVRAYIDDTGSVCWDVDPAVDSDKVWSNKVDLSPDTCYLDSEPVEV